MGERGRSFHCGTEGVHEPVAVHWLLEGPAGHEGPVPIIGTDLALSLLYVNKTQ